MDFISMLEWSVWKKLTDQEKTMVMNQVTMYFVSPLLKISDVRLEEHELFGIKSRTFSLKINDEEFLLVPGNSEAILGWDLGVKGLPPFEIISDQKNPRKLKLPVETEYDFSDLESIGQYINDYTTPLRRVSVPPMLVQKYSLPAGTSYMGTLNMITGEFTGDIGSYNLFETQIKNIIYPELSAEESLSWSFPRSALKEEKFFMELTAGGESYRIYRHHNWNYFEQEKVLNKYAFELLTEDQWEFAVGAGTRRLFRWGNELVFDESISRRMIQNQISLANMFGLVFDATKSRLELTRSPQVLKMDDYGEAFYPIVNMLPLASYYHSGKALNPQEKLDPSKYLYRKAVIIEA
ncbi:DUF7278 family profilin-like fold-containing protein [Enterococcus sp. LJL120]